MFALILSILFVVLPACEAEDSPNCAWDASQHNGIGRSFVDVGGTAYYVD